MITSQYTVSVKLYNRQLKKYATLSNIFNTIIESTSRDAILVKQSSILDYVEDAYELYLSENNILDSDISISSYKVESIDPALDFFFEESGEKNATRLMVRIFNASNFLWKSETFSDGVAYSWEPQITMNSLSNLWKDLSTEPYATAISESQYTFSKIIVEVFDPTNNIVLFTSVPDSSCFFIEAIENFNVQLTRELRIYSSTKNFLYSTGTFEVNPQTFNELPLVPLIESTGKEKRSVLSYSVLERLGLFQSGVGHGKDLSVEKNYEDYTNIDYNMIIKLLGGYKQDYSVFDKVSFYYKGQCSYKQDYKVVDGKVSFTAEAFQYGNIKLRMYKYGSEKLKINYNLTAKLTYFTNEPNGGNKTWRTVSLKVPQSFTHDIDPYLYYDGETVRIKETLWRGVVDPSGKDVKTILMDSIKGKYAIENTIHYLYDFNLEDVKVYNGTGELYHEGFNGPLDVTFQYSDNAVDVNRSVRYFNKGLTIYEGETFVDAEVDNNQRNILQGVNFGFPMYSRYNGKMLSNSINLKISVYSKDENVESILNSALNTCYCRSVKTFSIPEKHILLNESQTAYVFDMAEYIPENLPGPNKFNMTINVKGKLGPVTEHYSGKILNSISDTASMKIIGERTIGTLCVEAAPVTKTRTVTLYEPMDEYILGVVNGDEDTYGKEGNGKRSLSVQFRPFMIPSDGYAVTYELLLKDASPTLATVDHILTPTSNPYTYAFTVVFSSEHQGTASKDMLEEIQTYNYVEHFSNEEPRYDKYVITEPVSYPKPYTSFRVAVDTDNAEAEVKEYTKDVTFTLSKADIFTKTIPQKHPASQWKIKIRNGYYYINQHEKFLYSSSEPNGPKVIVEGKTYYSLTNNAVQLSPIPQQFAPVVVEDELGTSYQYIVPTEEDGLSIKDSYIAKENQKEFLLTRIDIDVISLVVKVNDVISTAYVLDEGMILFNEALKDKNEITVTYKVTNSFSLQDSTDTPNSCVLRINSENTLNKILVSYETNMTNNYKPLDLSINPLHRLEKSGFVYLTEDEEALQKIELVSEKSLKAGRDSISIFAIASDKYSNPVKGKTIVFSMTGPGALITETLVTDDNGVAIANLSSNLTGNCVVTASCEGVSADKEILSY